MSSLPTGTVTFLFTDIEGSTRLWELYPRAMQAALARHDTLLREVIEAHGGYIFKTAGDAFCAAFPTAAQGLEAALAAQRALHSTDWSSTGITAPLRVRMGWGCRRASRTARTQNSQSSLCRLKYSGERSIALAAPCYGTMPQSSMDSSGKAHGEQRRGACYQQ